MPGGDERHREAQAVGAWRNSRGCTNSGLELLQSAAMLFPPPLRKILFALALSYAATIAACDGGGQSGRRTDGTGGSGGRATDTGGVQQGGGSGTGGSTSGGSSATGGVGTGGRSETDAGSATSVGGSAGRGGASTDGSGNGGAGGAGNGGRSDSGAGGFATGGGSGNGGMAGATTTRDAAADGVRSQDATTTDADAGPTTPCQEPPTVFPWTTSWGLPHASKAVLACGVYVIGSSAVADAALLRAQQIVQVQLRKVSDDLPDVPAKLTASHSRLVVLGAQEDQSIYWPNASGRRSFCSWPDSRNMIEATTLEEELTSSQRSLLMTTVHEMGHFTQFISYVYNKSLYDRSVTAFNTCTKSLYNDYDLQDAQEFFAGDALRWFDLNPSDLAVSDANSLSQRDQLKKYDATMYQIMSESYVTTAIP
jgi:hypothetical protein